MYILFPSFWSFLKSRRSAFNTSTIIMIPIACIKHKKLWNLVPGITIKKKQINFTWL